MTVPTPVVGIVGNLVWGVDGGVWACYQVDPFGYPHRSIRDANQIHVRTVGAVLALPGRSLILSTVDGLSPGEVESRIASAAPEIPGWLGSARRSGTQAADDRMFERRWFLAFTLPSGNGSSGLVDRLRTAAAHVGTGFGLSPAPPSAHRVAAATDTAALIAGQVGQQLRIKPLSANQVRWLYQRAVLRGIHTLPYPPDYPRQRVSVVRLDSDTVYFEGGRKDDLDRPRHWRYIAVEHPDHGVGFQSFSCLGEMPVSWTHPYGSGEWLWHLDDQLPFGVDWAVRIERVDNQSAQRRALRAKRNLVGQLTEPGGDPAGPATTLASATDSVDGLRSVLESNPALPAFKATTIAAVAARDLKTVDSRVGVLESVFAAAEYNFYRPTGDQLACYTAMLPGAPDLAVISEYAQDLLPDGLASAAPFASAGVGDPTGMLIGVGLDTQYQTPVFWNPARGPTLNRSGSLAAVGELGAGKSFLAKTLAVGALGMGGQVVAVDRTERGEYAALAGIVTGTHQVVKLTSDATVCLDPFQVFPTDDLRAKYGVGFISLLTATPPGSSAGAHIYRAAQQTLDEAAARGTPARLTDVIPHLHSAGAASAEVADKLEALSQIEYGRLAFSEAAETVDLSADYVCFHIPGLKLPRRDTAREDLLAEELMGQALLYLVAAFARRILFSTPERFTALLLDEAHALTANPQGRALIGELIRDGRKHHAAVWAFTQLPGDITTSDNDDAEMVEGLLGYRIVFRQSPHTAPAALNFLGSDGRQENLDTATALKTGECLIRDLEGRIGLVRVVPPDDPNIQAAFDTTPTHKVVTDPWPSLNNHSPHPTVIQP